jgi:citrate/tricarballylate utilization protein
MARVRVQTYAEYAWPAPLGALYRRNGVVLTLVLVACLVMFLLLALRINGSLWAAIPGGDFYRVFPHNFLVWLFVPVTLWSVVALGVGVRRFLREVSPATSGASVNVSAAEEATRDMLSLKYLGGGHGRGCHNADDAYTLSRKRAHHLTFYGFLLCFAATSVATVYHYLFGWIAPYDFPSLPKLLGVVGGLSMLAGTAALFWLNLRRNPHLGDPAQKSMDIGFISLLFASAATGLVLWIARGSIAQSLILAVHLGVVMALFATLPYSKFAHAIFRGAALLRYSVEKRQANPVGLSAD